MLYRNFFFLTGAIIFLISVNSYGQVSISTDNAPPDSSAMLDIQSSSGGLLIPRMDSVQRQSISSPANGLLVFDTDINSFLYYSGSDWINLRSAIVLMDTDQDTKVEVDKKLGDNRITFSTAGKEMLIMEDSARISVMNSGKSIFLGKDAGANDNLSDNENVFIGEEAGFSNTEGNKNTFIGYQSGYNNIGGLQGFDSPGNRNTYIGWGSGYTNVDGFDNTLMGYNAGMNNTADRNVFLGAYTGIQNSTGEKNTFLGTAAGEFNFSGSQNVSIGMWAGRSNNGSTNVMIGSGAGQNSSGSGNVFLGFEAGKSVSDDHKLIIESAASLHPLIYGEFDTGKVGFGTTSPSEKLEVNGNILSTGDFIQIRDGNQSLSLVPNAAEGYVQLDAGGTGHSTDHIILGEAGSGNLNKVGIGTSNPGEVIPNTLLEVDGGHIVLANNYGVLSHNTAGTGFGAGFDTDTDDDLHLFAGEANRMTIGANGNIGIGTNAPEYPLHIESPGSSGQTIAMVIESATSKRPVILFSEVGSNHTLVNGMSIEYDGSGGGSNGNKLRFNKVGGNAALTIENGGQTGVNINSPAALMHILQSGTGSNDGLRLEHPTNTNYWDLFTGPGNELIFSYNGSPMSFINDANGAFGQFSDLKLKQDIELLEPILLKVAQLDPVMYRYRSQPLAEKSIGFIAQEVEKLFPEVVMEHKGVKAVDYNAFAVIAIQAIKELAGHNAMQLETNRQLKEKNDSLESRMERIEKLLGEKEIE